MGLFRKIGKVVGGKSKDVKDMTVAQLIDYKDFTKSKLAKKAKVSAKTLDKYADTVITDVPKGTQNKIKKALGIVD
tara:strand:- start:615 stop:842 length:228 start_codon:yes stop_codon:yes gene_type:complete